MSKFRSLSLTVAFLGITALAFGSGCDAPETSSDATETKSKSKKKEGATVPASAPVAPEPPSAADLDAMTWTEDGTAVALVDVDLKKKCLLKGMRMVLRKQRP